MQGAHYDGDPSNNYVGNLRWATIRENADDKIRHGSCAGERNGRAKLTEAEVRVLRATYQGLHGEQSRLAREYGLSSNGMRSVLIGEHWRMGSLSRTKGIATEREIVKLHKKIGLKAERVPLSGAMRYRQNAHDVDIYLDPDGAPLVCQVKRRPAIGDKLLRDWLADADILFLRYDAEPGEPIPPTLCVLPWSSWERLVRQRPPR